MLRIGAVTPNAPSSRHCSGHVLLPNVAEKLGYVDSSLKERVFNVFRRIGLSLFHPWFNEASLKKGTDTIMARRDGDLYAAIPDGQVGVCRYVMIGDFQNGPQKIGRAHV